MNQRKNIQAPPVYKPQPTPLVLQRKTALSSFVNANHRAPASPHHQQQQMAAKISNPKSGIMQPKIAVAAQPRIQAPPVYRPQPVPRVLQTKQAGPGGTNNTQPKVKTPSLYQPTQTMRVLQRNKAPATSQGTAPNSTSNRTGRFNASQPQQTGRRTIFEKPGSKAKPRPVVGGATSTRPMSGRIRSGLIQRYCTFPGCAIPDCTDRRNHLKYFALQHELLARSTIPFAGNQAPDLIVDPYATARHEHARFMNKTVLGGDPGEAGLENTLKTAASAIRYHGGMCNEYSAVVFGGLMQSPEISGQPICRYWNTEIGHSFTSFGDDRDPNLPQVIPDGWTLSRDSQFFGDTLMSGGTNHLKAMWADRWPGEGQLEATAIPAAIARLLVAEQDPQTQQHLRQIWNVNVQHQQQTAYRLLHGERLPGIYSYLSNRRPAGS